MKRKTNSHIDCLFIHVPRIASFDDIASISFANVIAMGVFSMSTELNKNGFTPQIINLGVEKALKKDFSIVDYIKNNNIKLVGFSLHWHYQTYDTLLVAKRIKESNPDTHIFLGGYTASAYADDILKEFSYIDTVIKGEGEKPIVEFANRIKNNNYDFSEIPNIHWRDKNGEIHANKEVWFANESELNSYSFDGLKFLKNSDTYLKFSIDNKYYNNEPDKIKLNNFGTFVCCLGRGCPGNCTWCGGGFEAIKHITGRNKITLRDPNVVAKEFIKLKNRYDRFAFYICYDPYPKNQDYLIQLFKILGKKKPKEIHIKFECFALPSKEFIDAFAENLEPFSQIILSPEFGNEKMRQIHKGNDYSYTNQELLDCIDYITSKKIPLMVYFTNLPFESAESKNETKQLINKLMGKSINNDISIAHQPITDVEPFSPWAIHPEKYNMPKRTFKIQDYINNSKKFRDFL